MIINDARYLEKENINVMLNSGTDDYAMLENDGVYSRELDQWQADGGVITPFDMYYGWSESDAYKSKKQEIYKYGDDLITTAYTNPIQGVDTDPVFYKEKVSRRKSNKADKFVGGITLKQNEKDEAKVDEKLSGYEVKITNDQDKAIVNLHKLTGVDNIMIFDVSAENWNVWAAPV